MEAVGVQCLHTLPRLLEARSDLPSRRASIIRHFRSMISPGSSINLRNESTALQARFVVVFPMM
jgi:hypothetical protein